MSQLIYQQMKEHIDAAQHVLLLTDNRVDGDTIGSTLGMYHVLMQMGKHVTVYSPEPLPAMLAFLPGTDVIRRDEEAIRQPSIDLAMVFDCSDGLYLQDILPTMPRQVPLISLDHHATNPNYGSVNLIEPGAAATGDVLWRFLQWADWKPNRDAAQCILTAICTDTNAFMTANTTAACMEAAHELSKYGAKLQQIVRETMMNKNVNTLRLWGLAFERLHHNDEFDALATAFTQRDVKRLKVDEADSSALIEFMNAMVDGVDVILVLREMEDGSVKGSLRSHNLDVAALAERHGGGGHKKAAGFKVPHAHLEEKDGRWFIVEDKPRSQRVDH